MIWLSVTWPSLDSTLCSRRIQASGFCRFKIYRNTTSTPSTDVSEAERSKLSRIQTSGRLLQSQPLRKHNHNTFYRRVRSREKFARWSLFKWQSLDSKLCRVHASPPVLATHHGSYCRDAITFYRSVRFSSSQADTIKALREKFANGWWWFFSWHHINIILLIYTHAHIYIYTIIQY